MEENRQMTRQFSLAHLTVLECTPPEMTYIAARAGYDLVSYRPIGLGTVNEPQYPLAKDKVMLRQTKAALAETGLNLLDIEMVRIYDGVDLKSYLASIEVAAELGARHVLTTVSSKNRPFVLECFAELCEMVKSYGLTIDLEFITWYPLATLQEAVDIVSRVGCDNAGILVDTLHFQRSRTRLEELDGLPHEWFHYAHVCNASSQIPTTKEELIHTGRENRLYLGEKGIDVAAILNRMPVIPYSLEIPHAKRAQELGYEEFARRCLETAKDYLDLHLRK
jgi:sugar phosphate isomerase/epimerase